MAQAGALPAAAGPVAPPQPVAVTVGALLITHSDIFWSLMLLGCCELGIRLQRPCALGQLGQDITIIDEPVLLEGIQGPELLASVK